MTSDIDHNALSLDSPASNRDYDLIQDILGGNTQRYSEIVSAYQQKVANLTYKIVGERFDVKEVTQQVFVELYLALPRFKYQSKLSTYIYKIAINVISKMLTRDNRFVRNDDTTQFDAPSHESNPEHQIIRTETQRQVRYCITKLKSEQRIALVLYTYKDLSYQEIADIMQVSLSKVESLIFRARKNIAKMLTQKN